MKIIFMGTPDIAAGILKKMHDERLDIIAVVTNPDKMKGRSKKAVFSPVKELALSYGYDVLQPARARDREFVDIIRDMAPDMIVVSAYGQILPKGLLDIPPMGCVNVHTSLLPKYRGAAPINQVIVDGCEMTGVTTMLMDAGIDTGDILMQCEVPIAEDETAETLTDKLTIEGGKLLIETIRGLADGTVTPRKQEGEASYVKMMKKEDGLIDWNKSARAIERLVRGLIPWPGAYTFISGKRIKILAAAVVDKAAPEGFSGRFFGDLTRELLVRTGEGTLSITRLQAEGKKPMDIADFLRGFRVTEDVSNDA